MTDVEALTSTPQKPARKPRKPRGPKAPRQAKPANPCYNAPFVERVINDAMYSVRLPFVPSNQQLKAYAIAKGHRLVTTREGGVTFDEVAIRKLLNRYKGDPVYARVEAYNEAQKCLGTYVQGMPVQADGRVHDTFKHVPKTLRLSAEIMQVLPRADDKDSVYARIREMFVASAGMLLLTRDYGGLEGVTMAYVAQDRDLYRLCNIDVHSFIASHAIGKPADLSWPDADLVAYFDDLKKANEAFIVAGAKTPIPFEIIRTSAKRAFYLSLYNGGPGEMMRREPDLFPTRQVGKWYQDLILGDEETGAGGLFPAVRQYQWRICEEAETKGYITAPSGFRQWFWNVFEYSFDKAKGQWTRTMGQVANSVIAANPQHIGFLFSAHAMARLASDPLLLEGLRLTVHDELLGEWAYGDLIEADARLKAVMEAPCPMLPLMDSWGGGFLSVATDAKIGAAWASMKKCKAVDQKILDSLSESH